MLKSRRMFIITGITALLTCCHGCAEDKSVKNEKTSSDQSQNVAANIPETDADKAKTSTTDIQTSRAGDKKQVDVKLLSEAFGNFIGRNLHNPGVNFDVEAMIKGIRDGAEGKPSPLSEQEYEEMMATFQENAFNQVAEINLKEANAFLEKNAKEPGVKEIIPGKLQFIIVEQGQGATVEEHSNPTINYTGKYLDGTVFGSSEQTGGSVTIPLDQTIPGFSKGLVGAKEGEKRKLFVHPDLGYGTMGQLPPNELLVFDIEVVKANTPNDTNKSPEDPKKEDGEIEIDEFDFEDVEEPQEASKPKS